MLPVNVLFLVDVILVKFMNYLIILTMQKLLTNNMIFIVRKNSPVL